MANKTTYNLKNGTSLALDITKEMVPKGRAAKIVDRIFSNVALGDERVKLTVELYSLRLDKYKANYTVQLDVEKKSGNVADTGSNRDGIYHAAWRLIRGFKDGLLRKDANKLFKRDPTDRNHQMLIVDLAKDETEFEHGFDRNHQRFIVDDLIKEVLENETGILAKCYCGFD